MNSRILLAALAGALIFSAGAAPMHADAACTPTKFWTGQCLNVNANPILPSCSPTGTGQCTLCDLLLLIQNAAYFGMSVAVFVLAPIVVSIGAVMITMSGGSPEKVSRGKGAIWSALIGLAIVLGAFVIVNTVIYVFDISFEGGGNWFNINCRA